MAREPARDQAATEDRAEQPVVAIRRTCPELLRAEFGGALHDQRLQSLPRVQPPGERECERDTGDHARNDERQRATPAARQRVQILLQFLLEAPARFGAL